MKKHRWLTNSIFALMVLLSLASIITPLEYVRGHSMDPTLKSGQWLVVVNAKVAAALHSPVRRGDIITFRNAGLVKKMASQRLLVKRVIGKPGDLIGITQTTVYRDGRALKEPYVKHQMNNQKYDYDGRQNGGALFSNPSFERTTLLKKNQYFVLGDNRPRSADSRWFGPIKASQIASKVLWRLPLNNRQPLVLGLWYLVHASPLLLLVLWFMLAYGSEFRRLLGGNANSRPAARGAKTKS